MPRLAFELVPPSRRSVSGVRDYAPLENEMVAIAETPTKARRIRPCRVRFMLTRPMDPTPRFQIGDRVICGNDKETTGIIMGCRRGFVVKNLDSDDDHPPTHSEMEYEGLTYARDDYGIYAVKRLGPRARVQFWHESELEMKPHDEQDEAAEELAVTQ